MTVFPSIFFAVAMHAPYARPTDALYTPVQAGAALHPPMQMMRDDAGASISRKNPNFCELTVMYWMWQNVQADWYGLCHYRRYFSLLHMGKKASRPLTMAQAQAILPQTDIFLPKKRHYWIETNWSQYAHAHHESDLQKARQVIALQHPGQEVLFDRVMARRSGHRFNMFLMRREVFQAYAQWLFPLLFALEEEIDWSGYSKRDQRVFGFLAERLLDVWLEGQNWRVKELPVVHLESQHWGKKIIAFLGRKLRGGENA